MKKIISIALVIAMVLSCVSMVSHAVPMSNTVLESGNLFVDFENESDVKNYFTIFQGNSLTYAEGKGKNGSGAMKYVGGDSGKSWYSPMLSNAVTTTVFDKPGYYTLSFDVYFETLPSDGGTGFEVILRYDNELSGKEHNANATKSFGSAGSGIPVNTWATVTKELLVTPTHHLGLKDIRFMFDSIGNGSVFYIDNFRLGERQIENELINPGAEAGADQFPAFSAGGTPTVSSVNGGANGTAKAIKVVATSQWASVGYKIGQRVINSHGFSGYGAVEYTLSFWAKADAATTLKAYLNSQVHLAGSKDPVPDIAAKYGLTAEDTYKYINSVNVTTEWQKFELKFTPTQNWLDLIDAIAYENNNPKAHDLVIRFEDVKGENRPVYYVDEFSLEPSIPSSVIEEGNIFFGFDDSNEVTKNFGPFDAGSVSYAADKGKDGSGALKYSGGINGWSAPMLKVSTFNSAIKESGKYMVTMDVFYEQLPDDFASNGVQIITRYDGGYQPYGVVSGSTKFEANTWYTVSQIIDVDLENHSNYQIMMDKVSPNGVLYIDNFSVKRVTGKIFEINKDVPLAGENKDTVVYPYWNVIDLTNGILKQDMADENGVITLKYNVYNMSTKPASFKIYFQNNWQSFTSKVNSYYIGDMIPAGGKSVATVALQTDGNGNVVKTDGSTFPLSNVNVRYDFEFRAENDYKGIRFYVEPVVNSWNDPVYMQVNPSFSSLISGTSPAASYVVAGNPIAKAVGATVSVGEDISVKYTVDVPVDFIDSTLQMEFTRNGKTTVVDGVKVDARTYEFDYTGINAQCMNDVISAKILVNGEVYQTLKDYSVKQNAVNLYNSTAAKLGISISEHAKLKTFLADMLAFGAEAQRYTGYKANDLVNDDIDWATSQFVAPQPVANKVVKNDANNQVTAAGLNVSNDIKIYYRLAVENGAVVKINGEAVEVVDGKVYTEGILATEFDKVFTLTVEVGGVVVTQINYTVNTYVHAMQGSATSGALAKAIGNFGASAVALG